MIEKLGYITYCGLNVHDRGIAMLNMSFDYEDGFSQGIGGLCLDTYDKEQNKRFATKEGFQKILDLLHAFKCNNLNELEGKYCMILLDKDGLNGVIKGVRSLRQLGQKQVMFSEGFEQ